MNNLIPNITTDEHENAAGATVFHPSILSNKFKSQRRPLHYSHPDTFPVPNGCYYCPTHTYPRFVNTYAGTYRDHQQQQQQKDMPKMMANMLGRLYQANHLSSVIGRRYIYRYMCSCQAGMAMSQLQPTTETGRSINLNAFAGS